MSGLWNPLAFGVAGQPVGPQVNVLRVHGEHFSAEQSATAQQAFARFCMTERLSFATNQTQIGVLPCGSTYRIVVVGNTRFMEVVPVEAKKKNDIYTTGFVFDLPSERYGILDAVLDGGAHTGQWRSVILTREEFIKLQAGLGIYSLRPSIKGPIGLPYSFYGNTFGVPLFNYYLIAPRRIFAFGDKKVYSLSENRSSEKLVCTISTLSANPALGQQQPPNIESERTVDVGDMVNYQSHYDSSFSGREVLLKVPNKQIVTQAYADRTVGEYYEENPGFWYYSPPTAPAFNMSVIGSEYDGPDKYKVYARTEDSFSFARDIALPPDVVFPPLAAYVIVGKSQARSFYGSLNVGTPPGPKPTSSWVVTDLELLESIEKNGKWVWRGRVRISSGMPANFSAKYEHTRHSFAAPPKFSFTGATTELILKNVYKYNIEGAGNFAAYSEGPTMTNYFPIAEAHLHMPGADGFRPGVEHEATYSTGTQSTNEISSSKTTTNIFGMEFVLVDSSAEIFVSSYSNSMEGIDGLGTEPYGNYDAQMNYSSRTLVREIRVYDPHLSLLVYAEHESSISHAMASESHSVFTRYGNSGAEFVTDASISAGARPQDFVVTKNRVVIEQRGVVKHVFDIPPGENVHDFHPGPWRLNFDRPAIALVNPPDSLHGFQHVSTASIDYKERNIAIVRPVGVAYLGYEYSVSGFLRLQLSYKKSPATGAAILDIYNSITAEYSHFAITSKGIKLLPGALLEAGLESTTQTTATSAI